MASLVSELLLGALVAAVVIGWWARRGERARIRTAVERRGGEVLELQAQQTARRRERAYAVRFRTREGRIVRAVCTSSLLGGVAAQDEWIESELLDTATGEGRTAVEALDEPSPCLACGAEIPARKSRCPRCGWSYRDTQ